MTYYLLSVHGPAERGEFGAYASQEEMEAAFATTGRFNAKLQDEGYWVFAGGLAPLGRVAMTADSAYLDNAAYFIGRCHYGLVDLPTALTDFQHVITDFPASVYVDNAMSYKARVQADQGDCPAARTTYDALVAQFPGSAYIAPTDTHLTGQGC